MLSLIITIVAIALVAVLVLATLFYGGIFFGKGSTKLIAQTLVNQSTQIAAAHDLASAQGQVLPEGLTVSIPADLLKMMPLPPVAAYATGTPHISDWEYYLPGNARFFGLNKRVNKDVCMAINQSQGFIGIPAVWDGVSRIQCFGPTGAGYTYLYRPSGQSDQQAQDVITKSIADALPSTPTAKPGYPRLCPDGTSIETGQCTNAGDSAGTPSDPDGFWVISADVVRAGPSDLQNFGVPTLENHGFSSTCPNGAIDPTSPAATPASSQAGDPFGSDGLIRTDWELFQDAEYPWVDALHRTWCIPAKQAEVLADAVLSAGVITGDAQTTITSNTDMDNTFGNSQNRTVQVTAKGVTWSILASAFTATSYTLDPWERRMLVGQKVAIGRTSDASVSYFPAPASASKDGLTFNAAAGTITFEPPLAPCSLSVANAPLGTGGAAVDILTVDQLTAMLKQDGSVWLTGNGDAGQFGNCSYMGSRVWTRVAVDAAYVGHGSTEVYITKKDGTVWKGSPTTGSMVRLPISGAIAADGLNNGNTLVVLKSDGTLWYLGAIGAISAGDTFAQLDSNVTRFALGASSVLYLKADGSLWQAGSNPEYQFGATAQDMSPHKLADGVVSFSFAGTTSAYVKLDGSVYAAGTDSWNTGIFGIPGVYTLQTYSRIASNLSPIAKVLVNQDKMWLLGTDGTLYGAGWDSTGAFGRGVEPGYSLATFTALANGVKVFGADTAALLIDQNNLLYGAGDNGGGQMGAGDNYGPFYGFTGITY